MNTDAHSEIGPDELAEFGEYRSPQSLAIVTLVMGCFCFLALFRTTLWVFPIVTLVLGIFSLRALAANPEKIGRKAALAGMLLAAFFLTWAASYRYVRETWLVNQARQYADMWFDLLKRQRLKEAHQLHVSLDKRAAAGASLDEFYQQQRYAQDDLVSFYDKEPLKEVVQFAPHAQFTFDGGGDRVSTLNSERIVLRYVAKYEEQGRMKEIPLRVQLLRSSGVSRGEFCWEIETITSE
jgi:hypothetical protein